MSSQTTPLKIIGKEFLYDENLFITNYNPFNTSNSSSFTGLFQPMMVTGKLYIFDKTNYNEPTRDQFQEVKNYSDLAQFKKSDGTTTVNYFNIALNLDYNSTNFEKTINLDVSNSTISIIPNIGTQSMDIFNSCFGVFIFDNSISNPNIKTYVDIPNANQVFMWLVPSNWINVGSNGTTEGINLVLGDPSKKTITKTNGYYHGPAEELISGYTQDASRPFAQNSTLSATSLPDTLTWVATGTLPTYAGWSKFVSYNNFAYMFGGSQSFGQSDTNSTNIYRATIAEDGTIGTYSLIGTLPTNVGRCNALVINNKLWLLGVIGTTDATQTYYCDINSDGSLGTWLSGINLADAVAYSTPVIVNNRIYFFGGYSSVSSTFKDHVICCDIGSNGIITRSYKLGTTLGMLYASYIVFTYGNKIFVAPGYNRTTSTYVSTIYSFVVNPDGTLQPAIAENSPPSTYSSKLIQIGSKVYILGGSNGTYQNTIYTADLSIVNGHVSLSTWRTGGSFPVAMHGNDGIIITKKYIYCYPGREGTTWANSDKIYTSDISTYNTGAKNYYKDTFHYRNNNSLPTFNDANGNVLYDTFNDGSFTFDLPASKINTDGSTTSITDAEVLTFVGNIEINNNKLSTANITLDDIIIDRTSDINLIKVQVILDEEILQKLQFVSKYSKNDIFNDGSTVAWYQFNGNLYDNVRKIYGDGSSYQNVNYGKGMANDYNFNTKDISGITSSWPVKCSMTSTSTATDIGQPIGNPHENSLSVTISCWLYWNGTANMMPLRIEGTNVSRSVFFNDTYVGLNTGNGDSYGISSSGFAGVWKHCIFQFDTDSNGKMWINGVAQTLSQNYGTPSTTNRKVAGGSISLFPTSYANFGLIANLRVINRAITDTEAKTLYRETPEYLTVKMMAPFVKDPAYPALTDKYITTVETKTKTNYINGRPWEQQYYIDRNDPDNLNFTLDTSLPFVCGWGETVVTKGRVYILGGSRSGTGNIGNPVATINVAPINTDGTIGTFVTSDSTLPLANNIFKTVLIKDRIFIFGGSNASGTSLSGVYSCLVNDDGTLGAWRTENSMPYTSYAHNIIVTKNRVYLIGGYDNGTFYNAIYSANINDDLTLGTWVNTNQTIPTATFTQKAILIKNKIYLCGGGISTGSTNQVYVSTMNADGTLTPFTLYGTIPVATQSFEMLVTKNRVYLFGGYQNTTTGVATNQTYSAPIDANGGIGTWVAGPTLPVSIHGQDYLVCTSSYVYILGGREYVSSGVWKDSSKVMRAPLNGGKNDYTGDNIQTTTYDVTTKKLNFIQQQNIQLKLPAKFDNNTSGIILDSMISEYNIEPDIKTIDFDGGNALFDVQQLSSNQSGGTIVNTGKKVYLYGGRSDNSSSVTQTVSNTLWVSNILNDGQLEGFTNIGTNSINLWGATNYTYTTPLGQTFCYIFGGVTPGLSTSMSTVSKIQRALVLSDGSISNWTTIGNTPTTGYSQIVIPNPEDPSYIWIFGGDSYSSGTYTSYRNKLYYYKIELDGSLTLIHNQTLNEIYYSPAVYVARDPKTNNQYMFIFGNIGDDTGTNEIRKYKISDNGFINYGYEVVGTIDHVKQSIYCLEDDNNIYLIGGYVNATAWKVGADNRVLKYSKKDLIEASVYNKLVPVMEPTISVPLWGNQGSFTKTSYGYYLICPFTSTSYSGSTAVNWQTTNRVVGFKINQSIVVGGSSLEVSNINMNIGKNDLKRSSSLNPSPKLLPNKLNTRLREELFSNLFYKQTQTLMEFNEAIKFKDTTPNGNNTIITLRDSTNAVAIGEREIKFLEWVNELSYLDMLSKYNEYIYISGIVGSSYKVIIPEIFNNILCDKNMYNISKEVFNYYYTNNSPSTFNIEIPSYNIDEILKCFTTFLSETSSKTIPTFESNGLNLPIYNKFKYGIQNNKISSIFIPQYNLLSNAKFKNIVPDSKLSNPICNINYTPYLYCKNSKYEIVGNTLSNSYFDNVLEEYYKNFSYFVSPTGSASNDGLSPKTPKNSLAGIPANTEVCLMPGTYTGYILYGSASEYTYYCSYHTLFHNVSGHKLYGCGDLTIIDRSDVIASATARDNPLVYARTGELHNCKVKYYAYNRSSYQAAITINSDFKFYNIKFEITGLYTLNYYNPVTIPYINCTFIGGTQQANYSDATHSIQSLNISSLPNIYKFLYAWHNNVIYDNIKQNCKITPAYTLLPICDDNDTNTDNSIILENVVNPTTISNMAYKVL